MFEGLVRQLLLGYLGRYIKDIQRDQLKITVWNEEVLLENVELILEAFDYLQLPFALKKGCVGRLSIRIPWKKLGWEPIIIMVDDVFISASQRNDWEWSLDAVERRELAGKKAKLAAAELAKLSRCMGDNQTGNLFMSYIAAKILDSIQVSVGNFHIVYCDLQPDSVVRFGLRFSSLTVTTQNVSRSFVSKVRGVQVTKLVEIEALGIYCDTLEYVDSEASNVEEISMLWRTPSSQSDRYDYLLDPFNVSLSLLVNRAGESAEELPQYSLSAELSALALTLNEAQLQQIFILLDYLQTSQLREKYGRYRPQVGSLSKKPDGWQKLWWHYAQNSILSDVKKKLKKTSWKYLGHRLSKRHLYVKLYKMKLDFLRREQPIGESVLSNLEEMERELDVDDILGYRSLAECKMQEVLSETNSITGTDYGTYSDEKPRVEDRSLSTTRRWLNWLSLGMLGAGGTDDSSHFSGVVSDEVVKDIYEATKFHPRVSQNTITVENVFKCAVSLSIQEISLVLHSMCTSQEITKIYLYEGVIECKLFDSLASIALNVNSGRILNPHNGKEILKLVGASRVSGIENEFSCRAKLDISPSHEIELSVKVTEPIEVTYDEDFAQALFQYLANSKNFKLQQERVWHSLNSFEDVPTRLLAKAKYALSSRCRMKWDVSLANPVLRLPYQNLDSKEYIIVFELESLYFTNKNEIDSLKSSTGDRLYHAERFLSSKDYAALDEIQLESLYDHFAIRLVDFEVKVAKSHASTAVLVLEKSCVSVDFACCIITDEPFLKQLEVNAVVTELTIYFSLLIDESVLALTEKVIELLDLQNFGSEDTNLKSSHCFIFNAWVGLFSFHVDLANDNENIPKLISYSEDLNVCFSLADTDDCYVSMGALKINFLPVRGEQENCILYSLRYPCSSSLGGVGEQQAPKFESQASCKSMIQFHYRAYRSINLLYHEYALNMREADIHCYPYVVKLVAGFVDKISSYHSSSQKNRFGGYGSIKSSKSMPHFGFQRLGFRHSFETIRQDHLPFVTHCKSDSVGNGESSVGSNLGCVKFSNFKDEKLVEKCRLKLETESIDGFSSEFASDSDAVLVPKDIADTLFYIVKMDISESKVQFHDSSCIIGTISLPKCGSSLVVSENLVDVNISAEDLLLTSSWCERYLNNFLWGPSSSSPILNVSVQKKKQPSPRLEVCVVVQHVMCILSSEYLAIIVGYFSLPEWMKDVEMGAENEAVGNNNLDDGTIVTYKFRILNSSLILPSEIGGLPDLKFDIEQSHISFMPECALSDVLQEIPHYFKVPVLKMTERNHCLSLSGHGFSLSVLLQKDIADNDLDSEQNLGFESITLAALVGTDVWIILPCDNLSAASTCIMSRIGNCELFVDDLYALQGFGALLEVINHMSLIKDEAKLFTSDIYQFLQSKCYFKDNIAAVELVKNFTEISCSVDSFLMKLSRHWKDSASLEHVATVNADFAVSVSLENESLKSLDFCFSSIALQSLLTSVVLAEFKSCCEDLPTTYRSFTRNSLVENKPLCTLPCIVIWVHYFDWSKIFRLLETYAENFQKLTRHEFLSRDSNKYPASSEIVMGNDYEGIGQGLDSVNNQYPEKTELETLGFTAASENIGVAINFPLFFGDGAFGKTLTAGFQVNCSSRGLLNGSDGNHGKYMTVMGHISRIEFSSVAGNVKLHSTLEKLYGDISIFKDEAVKSCSLFHVSQIILGTEVQSDKMKFGHLSLEILLECLEIHASHQVLSLFHTFVIDIPEAAASRGSVFESLQVKFRVLEICLVISDGRWSCSGPLFEVFFRNLILQASATRITFEGSISSDLEANYYNICKILWEPFVEPWNFEARMIRTNEMDIVLNRSAFTDVTVTSLAQLNLNITESLVECVFRTIEVVKDAWDLIEAADITETEEESKVVRCNKDACREQYAPYILQNLTSLPLAYYVYQKLGSAVQPVMVDENSVPPGVSVPIYTNHTPEDFYYRQDHFPHKHGDKQPNGVIHHLMSIHIAGTSVASIPCSIDHVGLTYFEVDFSKASNYGLDMKENIQDSSIQSFMVPVVFEVSLQQHSKLIRVYSRVIILNATSMPLELRFDIPFGVSPKILDPIYPGQEFPLPLHLAEAGRMRWRPLGNSYLWSEARSISNVLSQESKIGFLRSFACYPVHPSNEPFRCCLSVQSTELHAAPLGPSFHDQVQGGYHTNKRFVHQVTLSTPLVVFNYLPLSVWLKIGSDETSPSVMLSGMETPLHSIDPSHDVALEFKMEGYRSSILDFPRSEFFSTSAKFNGTKISQIETLHFEPVRGGSSMYVAFEKTVDIVSGAREIFVYVPFLLFNCTDYPLFISDSANVSKGTWSIVPCADVYLEHCATQSQEDGLGILSSNLAQRNRDKSFDAFGILPSQRSSIVTRRNVDLHPQRFTGNNFFSHNSTDSGNVKACIFSPCHISSAAEISVCIRKGFPESHVNRNSTSSWSAPFLLLPPSGSTSVLVPGSFSPAASIVSVACYNLTEPFSGRTQAIIFQSRYIIINSCSNEICYKQKGTNLVAQLGVGQHAHLQWTDTTRELLISICFNEPGWQWSGSFLPDCLGDTQVKMRNFVSGASKMMRVEVQNADILIKNEKILGSLHGNVGTNLILISDDDTGYMPYRIDNFSKERLEVYQQRCETSVTIVHPYSSCPYAWDEPCYPRRLTIEVLGDHVIGSYALDDLKEPIFVRLQATSEKPERTLLLRTCTEGATKVLSIIDSSYHVLKDTNEHLTSKLWKNETQKEKRDEVTCYTEKFSLFMQSFGISLINSQPQELLFACATNVRIDLLQNVERQRCYFEISSLQVDNQLRTTSYPVLLSFVHEYRSAQANNMYIDGSPKSVRETVLQTTSDSRDPVIILNAAKWRKRDLSLISFEYMKLSIAEFRLQLELELLLSLVEFIQAVTFDSKSKVLPLSNPTLHPLVYDMGSTKDMTSKLDQTYAGYIPVFNNIRKPCASLPSIVPIGEPWKQIQVLARRRRKMYFELFELSPIKFTLSFSSTPWMLRNGVLSSGESLIHRGVMALAEVDGARIHLKQFLCMQQIASWESFQEILLAHYTRQLLHEIYKVFGSAGVIGNPMGFARNLGLGIKDFLSAPARGISKSPTGLIRGMAQGTTSLLSNTVYALSDATSQFSRAAHKGIVAFAFDDPDGARLEKKKGGGSQSKGVINEVFEGLTGLLQSPIKEAEKHGLPGILSGVALGVAGLVARPTASILEVTGKTAQSIKNKSRFSNIRSQVLRARFPRPLNKGLPLKPYSWEEAVGASVLVETDDGLRYKNEVLVMCKALKQEGRFVVITEKILLVVSCSSLIDQQKGIAMDSEWLIEIEIELAKLIHADALGATISAVGCSSEPLWKLKTQQEKNALADPRFCNKQPLFHFNLELPSKSEAEELLRVLLSAIEADKRQGRDGGCIIHQCSIRNTGK